ncbi:MAG: hypothetical protein ACI845_004029 [Gammaproteobacteria bacterium]|jgi:hypothetical protein
MFKPCVTAGIISEIDLAGYRKGPIYIRASRHVPPASEQLMDFLFVVGGCNWVIVTKEAREKYLNALESASVGKDIRPFAECIISMMESE